MAQNQDVIKFSLMVKYKASGYNHNGGPRLGTGDRVQSRS